MPVAGSIKSVLGGLFPLLKASLMKDHVFPFYFLAGGRGKKFIFVCQKCMLYQGTCLALSLHFVALTVSLIILLGCVCHLGFGSGWFPTFSPLPVKERKEWKQ